MLESLNFNFDGVDSTNYPIININVGNGLFTENFMAQRSILEVTTRGNDKPYHQGIQRQPLSFPLSFYFTDVWDEDIIREIVRWLDVDYYRPFYFLDSPDRIFYCMPTDTPQILHNGLKQGYVSLTLRCDSPYVYSPTVLSELYEYDINISGSDLVIDCDSDFNVYPTIYIQKVGDGDITITNMTNGGQVFKFTDLLNGENLTVDCEQEDIISDSGYYRFDNFNGNYLELIYGLNTLHIEGTCEIQFKYEFKYKNGIL